METCKLCLKSVVKLEDSHFLSAGIYRRLRDLTAKNPNPMLLTPKGAVQTSKQITTPLLCSECEQRFSKHGENWVLVRCLQADGSFPLAALLASRPPDVSLPITPTRVYYAAGIPEINIAALTYFAASIFWRGTVHPWKSDRTVPVPLGPFFEDQLRQFLMGLQPFRRIIFRCGLWCARVKRSIASRTRPRAIGWEISFLPFSYAGVLLHAVRRQGHPGLHQRKVFCQRQRQPACSYERG